MARPRLLVRRVVAAPDEAAEAWPLSRVVALLHVADWLEWGPHAAHELVVRDAGAGDRSVVLMAWRVADAAGDPMYEGLDLTLAYGLSGLLSGSHLIPMPAGLGLAGGAL